MAFATPWRLYAGGQFEDDGDNWYYKNDDYAALLVNGQLADSMSVVLAERGPHQPIDMMLVIAL
ncbi:hypothetical protein PF008_g31425 [Phytophthora fragariae]|uniref:Uncharacterized protein n=2 Tax=Phytophthora fragariae TaxID=53985 RepID=A0A6G0Q3B2_9STRA|nr:hypothetical protein PF008_g31425 [Phytophthora fragariae]